MHSDYDIMMTVKGHNDGRSDREVRQHRSVSGDTELFEKVSKINGLCAVDKLNLHQSSITAVRVSSLCRCFRCLK